MKKVTVAICDVQDAYRERLAEYLMHKRAGQLQVYTFSLQHVFLEKEKDETFDIILLGKGFEKLSEKKLRDGLYVHLEETPEWPREREPAIFKYQSGEEILRCMFAHYLKLGRMNTGVNGSEKEIIGVYSPTHNRLQTPFALTMAQLLAGEKRVLYVNLGEWAGFGDWFQQEYHRDLADLLYLISGYGNQVQGILESVLHTVNRMDYIPPMTDAQLLCQATPEDYQGLLNLLVEKTEYEVILLDFGVMVPGFFSLLEQCTSIYCVADQGMLALSQRQQFEKSLLKNDMEHLAEKIAYVTFSLAEEQVVEREPALQQWLYGELGDRARAVRYMKSGTN